MSPGTLLDFFCSEKTFSNTSGSTHGLLKCLGPPLPAAFSDMSFCKGKAGNLLTKVLFSKSGQVAFCKCSFFKDWNVAFFKDCKNSLFKDGLL